MKKMEDVDGRIVPVPEGALIVGEIVFPPGTDLQRDIIDRLPETSTKIIKRKGKEIRVSNNRPTLPIGKLVPEEKP